MLTKYVLVEGHQYRVTAIYHGLDKSHKQILLILCEQLREGEVWRKQFSFKARL